MKLKGFTLIELLLAIGMGSIIFVLTSSLLITVINANNRSKKFDAFERTKNNLAVELSQCIRWAENLNVKKDILECDDKKYLMSDTALTRNGKRITEKQVLIKSFEIDKISLASYPLSLRLKIEMNLESDPTLSDLLDLTVTERVKVYE